MGALGHDCRNFGETSLESENIGRSVVCSQENGHTQGIAPGVLDCDHGASFAARWTANATWSENGISTVPKKAAGMRMTFLVTSTLT